MITLTRLDGSQIILNEALVELIEETPDTIITLHNGHSYIVKEKLDDIMKKIHDFNRKIRSNNKLK